MAWTRQQWDAFASLLEHGWSWPFSPAAGNAYRVLLDDVEPAAATKALRVLLQRGEQRRPAAAAIVELATADPGRPTWDEAFHALFTGRRAAMKACTEAEALERAEAVHPYLAAFIRVQGFDRLRVLPLFDPDYGELRRRELGEAYKQHTSVCDERMRTGRALGIKRQQQLPRKLDPLGVLALTPPADAGAARLRLVDGAEARRG